VSLWGTLHFQQTCVCVWIIQGDICLACLAITLRVLNTAEWFEELPIVGVTVPMMVLWTVDVRVLKTAFWLEVESYSQWLYWHKSIPYSEEGKSRVLLDSVAEVDCYCILHSGLRMLCITLHYSISVDSDARPACTESRRVVPSTFIKLLPYSMYVARHQWCESWRLCNMWVWVRKEIHQTTNQLLCCWSLDAQPTFQSQIALSYMWYIFTN